MSVEHMWVLDIFGQHLGAGCIVGVSVRPSGTLLGNINLLKYKFVLNICNLQYNNLGDLCCKQF
mgnify:CR=1 FL=1